MQKVAVWAGITLAMFVVVSSCRKDSSNEAELLEGKSVSANAETASPIQRSVNVSISSNTNGFLENLPAGYSSSTTTTYPLIISLHGLTEMGNGSSDLSKVANVGIPKLIKDKQFPASFVVNNVAYSFVVIAPQYKSWPSPVDVRAAIDYAKSKYRIDATRIYITGLTMGGGTTWDFAAYFGNLATAVAPIAGAYAPSTSMAQKIAQFKLPVWAFHNQNDPQTPSSHSTNWVNYINAAGANPKAKATIFAATGQDAWTKATDPNYREDGKNLYEWFLQYRFGQAPPPPPPPPPPTPTDSSAETQPAVQKAITYNVNGNIGGYYEALPARYASTTKKYPLIIVNHGVGELGNGTTDLAKLANNGITAMLKNKQFPANFKVGGQNYSFIVISPQYKAWPGTGDVQTLIDYAVSKYRVDPTRIYVTGLSMGGGITWEYAAAYANRIAAIVPICGASWPERTRSQKIAAAKLPVWAFHNNDDGTVPASYSKDYVSQINGYGANPQAKLTLWATGGHNAWSKATNPATKENNMNMYEWMLQYHR